jgi:hypothetical protein
MDPVMPGPDQVRFSDMALYLTRLKTTVRLGQSRGHPIEPSFGKWFYTSYTRLSSSDRGNGAAKVIKSRSIFWWGRPRGQDCWARTE